MPPASPSAAASAPDTPGATAPAAKVKSLLPFDLLRVGLKLAEGWRGLIFIGVLGGVAGGGAGWLLLRNKYTVQVQLVRREMPNTFQASEIGESFRPRQFTSPTVMTLMLASSMLEKTGAELQPPVDGLTLQRRIELLPDKNTELITVAYTTQDSPQRAADELNHYAGNVVKLLEDLQAQEARELLAFLSEQATGTQTALNQAYLDLQSFGKETGLSDPSRETDSLLRQIGDLDLKIEMAGISRQTTAFRIKQTENELKNQDPTMLQLADARVRLNELLATYTPQNPFVIEQQAKVRTLQEKSRKPASGQEGGFQNSGNTLANSLYLDLIHLRAEQDTAITEEQKLEAFRNDLKKRLDEIPDKTIVGTRLRSSVTSLETTRDLLAGRQREAQLFAEKALGYYRVFSPATPESMEKAGRGRKIVLLGVVGGIFCAGLLLARRALRAALDDRLVSPSDLRRMVRAPIAAMLPAESGLTAGELARWRFTTWAEIVKHCNPPPEGALIAGLVSAAPGEGKTTWLGHLSAAALDRGLKVLIIHCGPPGGGEPGPENQETSSPGPTGTAGSIQPTLPPGGSAPPAADPAAGEDQTPAEALAPPALPLPHTPAFPLEDALRNPARVLELLRHSQPPEARLAPADDFEWTPAWRELWRAALEIWAVEPALAVLVELPPAARTDSLLLAETLPALFWLSDSGHLRRRDLAPALDTIRGSGLPITASFLNRVPGIFLKLPDLGKFGLSLAAGFLLCSSGDARALDEVPDLSNDHVKEELPELSDKPATDEIPIQTIPSATAPASGGIHTPSTTSAESPAAAAPAPVEQPVPKPSPAGSPPPVKPAASAKKTESVPASTPAPAPQASKPEAKAKPATPDAGKAASAKKARTQPKTAEKSPAAPDSEKAPPPSPSPTASDTSKTTKPAPTPSHSTTPAPEAAPALQAEPPPESAASPAAAEPAESTTPPPSPAAEKSPAAEPDISSSAEATPPPAPTATPAPAAAPVGESAEKPASVIPLTPGEAPPVTLDDATNPAKPDSTAPAKSDAPVPSTDPTLLPSEPPPMDGLPEDGAAPAGTIPQSVPALPGAVDSPPAAPVMLPGPAKKPAPPPPSHPGLAPWQQQLTLGPGDTVNFSVYGYKQYTRSEVPIGPDGTLTYLQVSGFKAGGLTIDQLREGMTKALRAYMSNAHVIVTPGTWRSKKYFMLGTVVERGVYTLERPMSLMEAAARARGMETGFVEESTVELSDMKRAFIVRAGKRLPVDFAKLFYDGDMSQNIQLQPGDYIYFPSTTVNEVYVLGSVGSPGPTGMTPNLTAIGAITIRGGFTRAAWRKRVLIVRGPMEKPQVIVVDTAAILSGKQRDVPLEPLDLVYVTDKPWQYAAQVLDTAVKTFVQSAANSWVDENVQSVLGLAPGNN